MRLCDFHNLRTVLEHQLWLRLERGLLEVSILADVLHLHALQLLLLQIGKQLQDKKEKK
jgi:hypothetical protein